MTRKEEKTELICKDESYACFAVYRDKGCGFLEPVYHECQEIEQEFQRIPFLSKPPQTLQYRGRTLIQTFSPDFICYDKIILEIKAVSELCDEHRAQVLNCLSGDRLQIGFTRQLRSLPWDGVRASAPQKPGTCRSPTLEISRLFVCLVGQK